MSHRYRISVPVATLSLSTLAVAATLFLTPAAHSGDKPGSPGLFWGLPGLHSAVPRTMQSLPQPRAEPTDRFIVSYRSVQDSGESMGNARLARPALPAVSKAANARLNALRRLSTGADLIRTSRKLNSREVEALREELLAQPEVIAVEPDLRVQAQAAANDPGYPAQWHYQNGPDGNGINLEPAWDLSTGQGVVVAVLDTGITPHPDLAGQLVPGYDFIDDPATAVDGDGRDADPNDPGDWFVAEDCGGIGYDSDSSWHGTHVAGTVAAATNNGRGVAGVAHGARVQPVRVLGKCGGYTSDIIDAVTWASGGHVEGVPDNPTPAHVLNLSLSGGGACGVAQQAALTAAKRRGVTTVVAAGNWGMDMMLFSPANCDDVVTVTSVGTPVGPDGAWGTRSLFSNIGGDADVAAPGGSGQSPAESNVLSTWNLGTRGQGEPGYAWMAGTSMAAPHVAGIVALMQAAAIAAGHSPRTPWAVERILENTAYASHGLVDTHSCAPPFSVGCGKGVVDARAAVAVAMGREPLPADPPPVWPMYTPPRELENGVPQDGLNIFTIAKKTLKDGTNDGESGIRFRMEVPNGARHLIFHSIREFDPSRPEMAHVMGVRHKYMSRWDMLVDICYGNSIDSITSGNVPEINCTLPVPAGGDYYVALTATQTLPREQLFGGPTPAPYYGSMYASFVDANYPRSEVATATQLSRHRTEVRLNWNMGKRAVDIYRNGKKLATTGNNGTYLDKFQITGGGPMLYKICNKGTQECTDEVEIEYYSKA